MHKEYDETDLTWSSVERYYKYEKVVWGVRSNGIPRYTFLDKKGNKIKTNVIIL